MNDSTCSALAIRHWQNQNTELINILSKISNEQLEKEIVPDKNTGMYLLGHIIAVNEDMLSLFNLGERIYPELEKAFIHTPDKSGQEMPEPDALRAMWSNSTDRITQLFLNMDPEEWTKKHTAVSEEDFARW